MSEKGPSICKRTALQAIKHFASHRLSVKTRTSNGIRESSEGNHSVGIVQSGKEKVVGSVEETEWNVARLWEHRPQGHQAHSETS